MNLRDNKSKSEWADARLLALIFNKRNQFPVYLIHSVTERCNAQCSHCFVHKNAKKNELTVAEIERFCGEVGPNLFHVCLSGGEPLLRGDLAEIALTYFARTNARNIRISTNGYFADRAVKTVRQVLTNAPKKQLVVEVSFDGVGKDHDEIRKVDGLFERAVECYRRLAELEREFEYFQLNVNLTICSSNQHKLDALYAFLRTELGVQNISCTLTRGEPEKAEERKIDLDRYDRFTRQVEGDLMRSDLPGYSGGLHGYIVNAQNILARRRIVETVRNNRFISRCYAGNLAGVLLSDGTIMACELRSEVLGNIRKQNFRDIWLSGQTKAFKKSCDTCRCTHECFLAPTIVFNARYAPKLAALAAKMYLSNRKARVDKAAI